MNAAISRSRASDERGCSIYHEPCAVKEANTNKSAGHGAEHLHYFLPAVVKELVHEQPDIRVRALRKLQNILISGTHAECDPQHDTMELLRNLLEWFNLPTPSAADQVLALSILTRLAQDDLVRRMLVDLGAEQFMKDYETDVSPAIVPFITSLIYRLRGRVDDTVSNTPRSRYVSGKEPDLWSFSNTQQVVRDTAVGEQALKNWEFALLVDMDSEQKRAKEHKYLSQVRDECPGSGETTSSTLLGNNDCLSCPSHQSRAYQSMSSREGIGHAAGYTGVNPIKQIGRTDSLADVPDSGTLKSIMPCIPLEENDKKYLFNINVTLQQLDNPQVLLTAFKELREAVVFDFHSEVLLQKPCILQNTFEVVSKVKDNSVEHMVFEFLLELVRQIKGSLKISTEAAFQVHPESQPPLQTIQANVPAPNTICQPDLRKSYPIYLKPGASNDSESVLGSHTLSSGLGAVKEGGQPPIFTLSQSLHLFVLQLLPLLMNLQHRGLSLNVLYELLPLLKPSQDKNLPDKVQVYFTQYFHVLCEVLQALGRNSEDLDALCVEQTRKRNFDSRARHCLPLLSVLTFSAELLFLLQPSHVAGLLPSYLVKALTTSTGDLIFAECTFGTHKKVLYISFRLLRQAFELVQRPPFLNLSLVPYPAGGMVVAGCTSLQILIKLEIILSNITIRGRFFLRTYVPQTASKPLSSYVLFFSAYHLCLLQLAILPYLQYLDPEFYKSYTCAVEACGTLRMLRKRLASSEEAITQCKGRSTSPDIDMESLLTCMIEAASYSSYLNDNYLIRRQIRVVSELLRTELVKAWQQRTTGYIGNGNRDGNTDMPVGTSSDSILDKARVFILLVLSNTSISVRKSAYDSALEISDRERWLASEKKNKGHKGELAQGEECIVDHEIISVDDTYCLLHWRGGQARPLCVFQRFILYSPCILGEMITAGLHDGATCKQAAELLFYLIEDLTEVERSEIIDLHPWIECGGSLSPELGTLVDQISEMLLKAQLLLETGPSELNSEHRANVDCVELSGILRSLFSACISQRWRASSALLKVINSCSNSKTFASWWLETLPVLTYPSTRGSQRSQAKSSEDSSLPSIDPFQHCFIRQKDLITSTSISPNQAPGRKSHHKMSPSGQKKIEDLLSIFKSRSVGEIIRKSAVEHLTWLIEDPSLRCFLESDEELFEALIFEIANSVRKDKHFVQGSMHPDIMENILDEGQGGRCASPTLTDLGTACLSFLTKLASASALEGELKVRDLLVSNFFQHLWSLLPMVYHPSETARKDMAILLSFCLFSSDMLLSGLKRMGVIRDQPETCYQSPGTVTQICVPAPFAGAYCFPCQVIAVQIKSSSLNSSENPVDERFIRRFIAQTDLLEEGPENLLLQLERKASSTGESLKITELQAFSCLSVLHPEISIKRVLKLLGDPQLSYGVELQFLEELEAQCFRHPQAAKTLAQNSWAQSFQRFLARFPSATEDFTLMLKVIKLVQVILRSKSTDSSGFIAATTLIKQILLPLLATGLPSRPNMHHALVSGEGYPAVDLEVIILRMVVDTLLYSMEHADQELFYQVSVRLAKDTSFLSVLLSKFVKSSSSPYICCLLAVRCFTLIAKGLASFVGNNLLQSVRGQGSTSHKNKVSLNQENVETAVDQDLVQIILPLIKHMAHLHSHHYRLLRHKGLVREIVSCLWSVTSFVLPCIWQELWSSTGITYWLARLLEDQEAILRGMAYGILALLASPASPRTRELLTRNWPELGDVAVRSVLNEQECYAVREQGLSFLISATMWSSNERFSVTMEENSPPASFKVIDGVGINAALQRYEFWNRLPSILMTRNGTPGFYRVLVELILNLATSDVGFIKMKILEIPTFFKGLIQQLEYGVLRPKRTGRQERTISSCKHATDIFAVKANLGEILHILAQDEDARLQVLIQSEVTIDSLFSALDYCLSNQNASSLIVQGKCALISNRVEIGEDSEMYEEADTSEKLDRIADYERIEAIYQLAGVLNLVTGRVMCNAGPSSKEEINHIRVDDFMALNSDSEGLQGKKRIDGNVTAIMSEGTWRHYLHLVGSHSRMFLRMARLLNRIPVLTDLQDGRERMQRQGNVDLKPSALLRRVQLAVCSLVGTVLSKEIEAKAVLGYSGSKLSEVESRSEPHDGLAEHLYGVLLRLLEGAHEQVQRLKISQERDLMMYLQSLIMSVGRTLQNLITFSSKTKDFATGSDLPTTLMRFAYEIYTALEACGLVPKRLDTALTPASRSSSRHKSKHGNKVPKLSFQSNRSSTPGNSSSSGKLNEFHRDLLLEQLVLYVRLMKNYTYRSEMAVEACLEEGVFEFIWRLWAFALCEEELMHEVLGLLSNLAALSNSAKEIIALQACQGKKGGSLMDHVANMIYHLPLDQISYTTSIGLLQNVITLAEPRAMFLRKQYLTDSLQLFRGYIKTSDVLRQHLMLQLFINLSAYPNGQKMFLKGLPDGSTLDLLLDSVEQSEYVPASSSALFLLRNLAFCRDTRFFFLCNERTLPLLVRSLESSSLEARAYASSALWILASGERRVSVALKKIGVSSALTTAHEVAKEHLRIFQNLSTQKIDSNLGDEAVRKIGVLLRNTEQSLFAVNQLVGENGELDQHPPQIGV